MELDTLKMLSAIASDTIGFDIKGVKPTSDTGVIKWDNKLNGRSEESTHDLSDFGFVKSENQTPSGRVLEGIKELLKKDDLDGWEITNGENDVYLVSSPRSSWLSLAGREYVVDLKNKRVTCTSFS